MNNCCIISTAVSSVAEADKITALLLEQRAAACVQQININSAYHWQGKIEHSAEILMLIKTREELYPLVEKLIKTNHSYQLPEIIRLPIADGLPAYLNWIGKETRHPED